MPLKILFVTPYVPSIVRIRPFAFIRELASLGHRITMVCLVQPAWENTYLSELTPFCEAIYPVYITGVSPYVSTLASIPMRMPLSVAFCHSKAFNHLVQNLVSKNKYDVIHTEFVRAAPATMNIQGVPKVFDAVDSLTLAYQRSLHAVHVPPSQRLVSLVEWVKMRKYEPWILQHYDKTIISSPVDLTKLSSLDHSSEIIPNGVDFDYFSNQMRCPVDETIVFLGKMSYYVNVASVLWFYREVFPRIQQQHPNTHFLIVGRNPVPAINKLTIDPAVSVTGTVPDVRPYLAKASVAICPMVSGSGIQNKLMEAMAMGIPCVSTSIACSALNTIPGQDVLVADTAQDFASAVCSILEQPDLNKALSENGRQYVEHFHDWKVIGNSLNQIYRELVHS